MDEVERLRAEIVELFSLMDNLVDRDSDQALAQACGEAIAVRLDRLEHLQEVAHDPRR